MTLSTQVPAALKTDSAPGLLNVFLPDAFRPSHFLDDFSIAISFCSDEIKVQDVRHIHQQASRVDRSMRTPPESSSSTASEADILASTGILTVRNIGIGIAGASGYELISALRDLKEAVDEAREEGFPVPSNSALKYARTILYAVYELSPRRYEVYPTPDGEIAIDAPGGFGRSVLLLCDSDGGALCLVNLSGSHRRARYSDAKMLPDGFVREALEELGPWNDPDA